MVAKGSNFISGVMWRGKFGPATIGDDDRAEG